MKVLEDLKEAVTGVPVTVTLAGREFVLAYPMAAVILYKKETAAIDRARTQLRPKMTRELIRNLRETRRGLLEEADALRPKAGEAWDPASFSKFEELLEESTAVKVALDEDRAAGDSLYDIYNWRKISPEGDPERMLLVLWVGLHKFEETAEGHHLVYRPQITREDLAQRITLRNGGDLTIAISKALSAYLVAPAEPGQENAAEEAESPNEVEPAVPASSAK